MDLPTMRQATSRAPCHSNPQLNSQCVENLLDLDRIVVGKRRGLAILDDALEPGVAGG